MSSDTNKKNDLPPETDREKNARLVREDNASKLQHRKDLGAEGKLWAIEVTYREGNITHRLQNNNFTWAECGEFREVCYVRGALYQVDPGRWRVISPYDILDIFLIRQNKFMKP
jgi:hypothetical protein